MRVLPLLCSLWVLTPVTVYAQVADTLSYAAALERAETQGREELHDRVAARLTALIPPPALDSLHREFLARARTLATLEHEYLHQIHGAAAWCAVSFEATNCGTEERRKDPSVNLLRQQVQLALGRYDTVERALMSAARSLAVR